MNTKVAIYFYYPNGGRGARRFNVKNFNLWIKNKIKEWNNKGYNLQDANSGKMVGINGLKNHQHRFMLYAWPDNYKEAQYITWKQIELTWK